MNKLEPWQQHALDSIKQYKGRGMVQITGRQSGKSQMQAYARMFNDIMNAKTKISDLVLGEGKVYGSRYYTVEPVGGSWFDMEVWCIRTFGEGNVSPIWGEEKAPKPSLRWYANNRKFWFREEKDRDWFILRWSS